MFDEIAFSPGIILTMEWKSWIKKIFFKSGIIIE